jgi:hypothetical protein
LQNSNRPFWGAIIGTPRRGCCTQLVEASNNPIWAESNQHFCIAQMRPFREFQERIPQKWVPVLRQECAPNY